MARDPAGQTEWIVTKLHRFNSRDEPPTGELVRDPAGALYGATAHASTPYVYDGGVVFKLSPPTGLQTTWKYEVLKRLAAPSDPYFPAGLYRSGTGTVFFAGQYGGVAGKGAVIALSPP